MPYDLPSGSGAYSATSGTYAKHVNMQQHNDACYYSCYFWGFHAERETFVMGFECANKTPTVLTCDPEWQLTNSSHANKWW